MATSAPNPASLARAAVRRQNPRQEPGALNAHAGICAGGGPSPQAKARPYRDRTRTAAARDVRKEALMRVLVAQTDLQLAHQRAEELLMDGHDSLLGPTARATRLKLAEPLAGWLCGLLRHLELVDVELHATRRQKLSKHAPKAQEPNALVQGVGDELGPLLAVSRAAYALRFHRCRPNARLTSPSSAPPGSSAGWLAPTWLSTRRTACASGWRAAPRKSSPACVRTFQPERGGGRWFWPTQEAQRGQLRIEPAAKPQGLRVVDTQVAPARNRRSPSRVVIVQRRHGRARPGQGGRQRGEALTDSTA